MAVRVHPGRKPATESLRSRLERLAYLPIRPLTARQIMSSAPEQSADESGLPFDSFKTRQARELDPGWVLGEQSCTGPTSLIRLVAERPWWPPGTSAGPVGEALQRLWRHSVAVSIATRWLAREAGDPDQECLVHAGLLHGLGRWAAAAVDPTWIVRWLDLQDARARHLLEVSELGIDLCDLGRRLAERWGCRPQVVDAAWLHAQPTETLNPASNDPARLSLVQRAYQWAECTPWSLLPSTKSESLCTDPRLKILIAEVQSRCGALFAAADATLHEEVMTQRSARLTLRLLEAERASLSQHRLLHALATADPFETPDGWANRAGMLWCAEPEVTAARVVWNPCPGDVPAVSEAAPVNHEPRAGESTEGDERPPTFVIFLGTQDQRFAQVSLWSDPAQPDLIARLEAAAVIPAWRTWASLVANRAVQDRRLGAIVTALRQQAGHEQTRFQTEKLEALAEFAAGAGHELNNPLAVIVGRAQLLLGRTHDAETERSLRIILGQAQRTHRILRDLMFVARPPAPRPRACRPSEILRTCLRGFQEECDARGIRLYGEFDGGESPAWSDPESLGHLAEILVRNAIQVTPSGGKVQVRSSMQGGDLKWWFCDSGKGISPVEGAHLFDPFFCGRQAGRGLGLGLSRAGRIVAQSGGTLRWSSSNGQGSVFEVQLPLTSPPESAAPRGVSSHDS